MNYRLQDLIDIELFQDLQDRLNEIYTFPSAIIDNDGTVLTATAWQEVCTEFHRKNDACRAHCIESDRYICSRLEAADPAVTYRCPHGLVDNAAPIIIEEVHLGSFFTGQFFLEEPDLAFFRRQARVYGFDENAYIEAVRKVPVWTSEQLDSYLFFIKGLIAVICESGLKRLREIEARKRMEASEERANAVIRKTHEGFWMLDPHDGRIVDANDAMCVMTGYTRPELVGMKVESLETDAPSEGAQRYTAALAGFRAGAERFESRLRRKDGAVIDVEANVANLGSLGLCFAFHRDITGRKRSEREIKAKTRTLEAVFENAPYAMMLVDGAGRLISINRKGTEVAGRDRDEIIGMFGGEIFGCMSFHDGPGCGKSEACALCPVRSSVVHTWDSGEAVTERHGHLEILRDGVPVTRHIVVSTARVATENGDAVLVTIGDVTDRVTAESSLAESERKYRTLFENMKQGVFFQKQGGELFDVNAAALEFFGLTEDQFLGKTSFDPQWVIVNASGELLPAREHPSMVALSTGEAVRDVVIGVRNFMDEGMRWAVVNAIPQSFSEDELPSQVFVSIHEITEIRRAEEERKKLESRLVQGQKIEAVGRLAGGVAHDFNNMLSVIIGNAEMALSALDPSDPVHESLEEIRKAADRSASLTRQLLAFARKQTASPRVICLNETVESALRMLGRLIGEDIELAWRPGRALWPVKIDPYQIDQILTNLCVNGRDAIADVGTVSIETSNTTFADDEAPELGDMPAGDYVMLTVRDTGCGMDKDTLAMVFEPFFTSKGAGKGTGLGLPTVYGIVKQNDGFIDVSSRLGAGSVFTIYLPRHAAGLEAARAAESARRLPGGSETILLVEDEAPVLRLTKHMLEGLGYRVLPAAGAAEAMRIAGEYPERIDLLISDVVMPEMNGRDLAKRLLDIRPGIKRLFMSGYAAEVLSKGRVFDREKLIQKPFSAQRFAAAVREALHGESS